MPMEAIQRPNTLTPASTAAVSNVINGNTGARNTAAAGRASAIHPQAPDSQATQRTLTPIRQLKRGQDSNHNLQANVARAQQAVDYLERIESQLEAIKATLMSKISGSNAGRQLESRTKQLSAELAKRNTEGGGGVDADLNFNDGDPADVTFRIQGMDLASLRTQAPVTLGFSVGALGGPNLSATIEPGMSDEDIAKRLDRTLAPVGVRAKLDQRHELVFNARESNWHGIKDAIAVTGRGRVDTSVVPPELAPQEWQIGNPDALRESLREVVQALARVRRSQDAAMAALSAAMARNVQTDVPVEALEQIAGNFSLTAASHDYASLLEITAAVVGVSRDRVSALLSLR